MSRSNSSNSSYSSNNKVKSFIISIDKDEPIPLLKKGSIKEIKNNLTGEEIIKDIEELEKTAEVIINNINNINVECSKCTGIFKNIFNKCRDNKATVI